MKSSALQLAKQIVNDNKRFIEGNISEYMIQEVESNDSNLYQYLTDEEIEECESTIRNKRGNHFRAVQNMLCENFNYDISEFEY